MTDPVQGTSSQPSSQSDSIRSVFRKRAGLSDSPQGESQVGDAGRRVHDTVTLSDGAQKVVNLQRGAKLAEEAKSRTVDQDFARFLGDSMADIKRITKLFNGTFMSFFKQIRGG